MTTHARARVHRMFELVEPIATVSFSDRVTRAFRATGLRDYWDGYFAGRAAPLGAASAQLVDAVFYNFAPGEVARHVPWVWERVTPAQALAIREQASAETLRERLGAHAASPSLPRLAELAARAAASGPTEGRPLYAGLRALAVPDEPVTRLWHVANLLREYRGDSHNSVLVAHGIGGAEGHVLFAYSLGMPAEEFSRLQHLPREYVASVVAGLSARGLVAGAGLTDLGRETKERIEAVTDDLSAGTYDVLDAAELDELVAGLESFDLYAPRPS